MNPTELDELRGKVAELCGWTIVVHRPPMLGEHEAFACAIGVPDYPRDLNACAEFEKMLSKEQCELYQAYLSYGEGYIEDGYAATEYVFHTPAEQRCRAFITVMEAKQT